MDQENVQESRTPFLYMTIEDISDVKATTFWKNDRVRVLGKVYVSLEDTNHTAVLVSPLKSNKNYKLNLNVESLSDGLPQGRLLEVFGYLEVIPTHAPSLQVLFYRIVNGASISSYNRAISLRNKYVPQYNDKDDETSFMSEVSSASHLLE